MRIAIEIGDRKHFKSNQPRQRISQEPTLFKYEANITYSEHLARQEPAVSDYRLQLSPDWFQQI